MKKEEILKRSRAEKYDEGKSILNDKAMRIASFIILIILLLEFIVSLVTGKEHSFASAVLGAFFTGTFYIQYKYYGRKKFYLGMSIFCAVMVIVNLLDHFSIL